MDFPLRTLFFAFFTPFRMESRYVCKPTPVLSFPLLPRDVFSKRQRIVLSVPH